MMEVQCPTIEQLNMYPWSASLLTGLPSWFELGTSWQPTTPSTGYKENGFPALSPIVSLQYYRVMLRINGQCHDGNTADGDGCGSNLFVERWSVCDSVGEFFKRSQCIQFASFTPAAALDFVSSLSTHPAGLSVRLLDDTWTAASTFGQNIGINTTISYVFKCPISDCTASGIIHDLVRLSRFLLSVSQLLTLQQALFADGVYHNVTAITVFRSGEVEIDVVSVAPALAVGSTLRLLWWMNVVPGAPDLDLLAPGGPLVVAGPLYTLTSNDYTALPTMASWVPVGVTVHDNNRRRHFNFKGRILRNATVSAWVYDGASTLATSVLVSDAALRPFAVTCQRSQFNFTCFGDAPDLSNANVDSVIVVRLNYSLSGLSGSYPLRPIARALQLPVVYPVGRIIAANFDVLDISGAGFRPSTDPNTQIVLYFNQSTVLSGSGFESAFDTPTSKRFVAASQAVQTDYAPFFANVTSYGIVSSMQIGTLFKGTRIRDRFCFLP